MKCCKGALGTWHRICTGRWETLQLHDSTVLCMICCASLEASLGWLLARPVLRVHLVQCN